MSQIIIYPREDGGLCLVFPTYELPVEEVAKRDLPPGVPYLIVPPEYIPDDPNFVDAWEADFSTPDGYAIGIQAWNIENGIE